MGKKNFEEWVNSMQNRVVTTFKDEYELASTVELAGYDIVNFGMAKKTHFGGGKFFFWELIDGNWEAIFSRNDNKTQVNNLIRKIEEAAGKKIFLNDKEKEKPIETKNTIKYPTNFVDKNILRKTLEEYNLPFVEKENGLFECVFDDCKLSLLKNNKEYYEVEIEYNKKLDLAYFHLNNLDEEYKRNVQSAVYKEVISKINAKSLSIENEEVLDDNSIVLTISI